MKANKYVEVFNSNSKEVILVANESDLKLKEMPENAVVKTIYFVFVNLEKNTIYMNYDRLLEEKEEEYFAYVRQGESYEDTLKRVIKEQFKIEIKDMKNSVIKYLKEDLRTNLYKHEAIQFCVIDTSEIKIDKNSILNEKRFFKKIKKTVKYFSSFEDTDFTFAHRISEFISTL